MAIFIPGMRCALSGREIRSADEAIVFPAFVSNELDPLHVFSDSVMHVDAFRAHPLAAQAQARYEEARQRTAPGKRACLICQQLITDPDNYVGLGFLIDEPAHPLSRFNYAHFHRSCLSSWSQLPELIQHLDQLDRSGLWKGEGLQRMIRNLRAVAV